MASTPNFAATPKVGHVQLDSTTSTNLSSVAITGGTSGTRIREIRVVSGPTTAPGASVTKLFVVMEISGTARRIDTLTLSNAVDAFQGRLVYDNLLLPSSSYTLKFAVNAALASGTPSATLDVVVIGEDF